MPIPSLEVFLTRLLTGLVGSMLLGRATSGGPRDFERVPRRVKAALLAHKANLVPQEPGPAQTDFELLRKRLRPWRRGLYDYTLQDYALSRCERNIEQTILGGAHYVDTAIIIQAIDELLPFTKWEEVR